MTIGRVADPDAIVRLASRDGREATTLLMETLVPIAAAFDDWPDLLAADLRARRVSSLAAWADAIGLAPSSVSRGFRLAYGVSPKRFRAELRAGEAARALQRTSAGLAAVASDSGFADQPHLTRTVRGMFGCSPAQLRARVKCVQDGGGGGD
jgi:AraC-like DNA-binding protein